MTKLIWDVEVSFNESWNYCHSDSVVQSQNIGPYLGFDSDTFEDTYIGPFLHYHSHYNLIS